MTSIATRVALLPDAPYIHSIIAPYAQQGVLLPRSMPELCENIRDFVVAHQGDRILGCGALHLYGTHLAEIRSIAVCPTVQGRGIGRALVNALMDEARRHSVTCVCLFTRTPQFFTRLGFAVAKREDLPDKIYKDCVCCPKLTDCDEIAMVSGKIPERKDVFRGSGISIPLVRVRP